MPAPGDTTFYRTAELDPIADAYERMFPSLFDADFAEHRPSVAAHFRYPEPIYDVQSRIYGAIHVRRSGPVLQRRGPVDDPGQSRLGGSARRASPSATRCRRIT